MLRGLETPNDTSALPGTAILEFVLEPEITVPVYDETSELS